ncbi:serine hydrolase [Thermogemmatispora sp.]|uniref:D-alanyl-D-alanine carboxypeptidase family protein n=1 Tax=Thermogemmatispora sp. TaxID=1968838 RepID=UPI0035E41880
MQRTPLNDDEQRAYPPASSPRQAPQYARQRAQRSRRLPPLDDSDPSSTISTNTASWRSVPVPKRRASLRASRAADQPRLSRRGMGAAPLPPEQDEERSQPGPTTSTNRHQVLGGASPSQRGASGRLTFDDDDDDELPGFTQQRRPPSPATSSGRMRAVTPPPRPPRPAAPPPPDLFRRLHDLSHNKMLLLLCAAVLVVLVSLIPLLVSWLGTPRPMGLSVQQNTATAAATALNQAPVNPHQVVIIPSDTDHPPPPVLATAAYLMDMDTGATLYAYNPFMHLPMLSTTKLMTALLAVEKGNLDQKVTITSALYSDIQQHISSDSSLFGLKKGETYTLRELLYGLLLPSGNDAAVAIADAVGGSYQHFVDMMNQRARELGMYDTHYMNPSGLLATGHYSSAHDLAVLGRYTMSNPVLHQIAGTRMYNIPKTAQHAQHYLVNGNQFLWWYPGADGGKPGWDGNTDFVQVVSCTRNNRHLIGVTMNTKDWWTDMRDLMNWGFNNFQWISPYDVDLQHPIPYDYDWDYFARDKKTNTLPTANHGRYYIYTGYSVSPPILTFFDKNGGLDKFGFPISMPDYSQGNVISQRFQKATIQCDLSGKQCKRL